ncbi:cupin domain-containing protein [Undibacterium terreum]|uniref:Cupin n=1 Tax=Undibacterium terreum TaxID=1224302 RepID=A0A916UUX0_9BURK|nr:cupin domain-containing protein [Undibacterium terreum]GGC89088.1 cupin [Undibacterium terreum]
MNIRSLLLQSVFGGLLAISTQVFSAEAEAPRETVVPAFAYGIPNVPGKSITALLVTYEPGGKSLPHRHGQAFVVAYVLEGAIRSKLEGGKEEVFKAGQSWTEKPGAHHVVSDNASATEPAKLLAIFITESKNTNLVTFDKK